MSIAMMKELVMVRPRLGSNNGMGRDHICYKDRRANAPFVVCGDHICYKDRRANAPFVIVGMIIGYKDHRANAPFVVCGDHICYKDRRANAPNLLKDSMITKMNSFKNFLVFCDLKVRRLQTFSAP